VSERSVRLSLAARHDLDRLADFLANENESAAVRAMDRLEAALLSLSNLSERGRPAVQHGWRELVVPFGAAAYVIQYRLERDAVFVARVFHSREQR
jgi:plasmid stabilization system protein ParE